MNNTGYYSTDVGLLLVIAFLSPIAWFALLQIIAYLNQPTLTPVTVYVEKKQEKRGAISEAKYKTRDDIMDDGVEALKSLGYTKKEAVRKVNGACVKKKYYKVEDLVQDIALRVS